MIRLINKLLIIISVICFVSTTLYSRPPVNTPKQKKNDNVKRVAAGCAPATAKWFLDYNNVSCRIDGTGGSMWQDRENGVAAYVVPKKSGRTSIFAGALWMGGQDINGQLKIAASTFRAGGNNFWPGPLNSQTAEIDAATCAEWDKPFHITRAEVNEFVAWWECKNDPNCDASDLFPNYKIPKEILEWPAHGDVSKGQDFNMAPFYDNDGNGIYNPTTGGDYPYYDLGGKVDCRRTRVNLLYGDDTYWWVFNDKGNIHTDPVSPSIGMEIHGQSFAFATNDEVNNMTFYNYVLINRSTFTLTNTYFGQWVDPDLGFAGDDFVGCDVQRGLGYVYNGDNFDEDGNGAKGYGAQPPAVGVDFFQGPYQDNDGIDNPLTTNIATAIQQKGLPYDGLGVGYGDSIADNERMGMFLFNYYNIGSGPQGDPHTALDHYNYLRGIWRDGTPFTFGGNGKGGTINSNYMFPGKSDPLHWATEGVVPPGNNDWTEGTAGNTPGDRRFVQSAGPFTLQPGAVNNITVGVVWSRATSGGPFASVQKLRVEDDKAQALFDNCFQVLNGPDAPDISLQELENKLILYISNPKISNNFQEGYAEMDPYIALPDTLDGKVLTPADKVKLKTYRFEGYQVFQLKNASASVTDLHNQDKARLVAQCDIKNGVSKLVNFEYSTKLNANVPTLEVEGEDKGIRHSFEFTKDAFSSGESNKLVNHKTYYYLVMAYAYNNYKEYDQSNPLKLDGQKEPYLASRKAAIGAIEVQSGIPHDPKPEREGTKQQVKYGDGPQITRVEGRGNGGLDVDLTEKSVNEILKNTFMPNITYKSGKGPVDVKIVDPLNVPNAEFSLALKDSIGANDSLNNGYWILTNNKTGESITSNRTIKIANEQLIMKWGLSVEIKQVDNPGIDKNITNGYINSGITFEDPGKTWLTGVQDLDGATDYNWIRSGTEFFQTSKDPNIIKYKDFGGIDSIEAYEKVVNGTWAPFRLVPVSDEVTYNPIAFGEIPRKLSNIKFYPSVDIVFTSDKSKWTRCPVLETENDPGVAIGGAKFLTLRQSSSVDKNGKDDGSATMGMGWFPGYAIDVETGDRLNMAFGEDSWLVGENGADMIWNPTANKEGELSYNNGAHRVLTWGGKHYIYVFRHTIDPSDPAYGSPTLEMPAYDEGKHLYDKIKSGGPLDTRFAWSSCTWVGIPLLTQDAHLLSVKDGLIPTKTTVRIRVDRSYQKFETGNNLNNGLPLYSFSTKNFSTITEDKLMAEDALKEINVVPNPYYAESGYETSQLDNRIKITNVPDECTISIYNMSGTLVRRFEKANPKTSLDWDLKNTYGVPIAGGVYLIHVEVPGVGEKVLKWFGILRPVDLNTF